MNDTNLNLMGISPELDAVVYDIAEHAGLYARWFPGNAGDISVTLSRGLTQVLVTEFGGSATDWFPLSGISQLAPLRTDGRQGYRLEDPTDARFHELIRELSGHCVLITRTGASLPLLRGDLRRGASGQHLCVLELDSKGDDFRVLYGYAQSGSLPSIETHIHLVGHAASVQAGSSRSAVVHGHPPDLRHLARHPTIDGHEARLNALLFSQVEGLNRNYEGLVSLLPYEASGSAALVAATIPAILEQRVIVWANHGTVVRAETVPQAFALMAYAEEGASAALEHLRTGARGLPRPALQEVLEGRRLMSTFLHLSNKTPDTGWRVDTDSGDTNG